jgi:hypothetical protein
MWYLVYICDHQFSIAYGKPPMTHEFETLNPAAAFLRSPHATEDDARLISEVEIWSTSTHVLETFGVDTDAPLSDGAVPQLRRYGIALDTWRANWSERFSRNSHIGNYPRKSVGLHFHFAKLYLCAHVFRGSNKIANILSDMSSDMEEFANTAILSATSILRSIVSDTEIQLLLNGMPLYFDTMIAFTVVFLLKIATTKTRGLRVNSQEIMGLVGQLVAVLNSLKPDFHQRHLLLSIATSVEKLLDRCLQSTNQEIILPPSTHRHPDSITPESMQSWMTGSSNTLFMGNYEFLETRSLLNSFDFDMNSVDFDQMQH